MSRLILRSPAKLNLFLKVINKRPDGFHNIKTLFERIDLCDTIVLKANRTGAIHLACDHPALRSAASNLVVRAARLLQDRYHVKVGVDIRLIKKIPVAAGLAGGSSNAATVLTGLNRLWSLGLSQPVLMRHGRSLGSDVPFFLAQTPWGLGTGRGDRIKPVKIPHRFWHLLIVPRLKIYSAEVFRGLNLQLTKTNDNVNILIRHLLNNNIYKINSVLCNDLETSICENCLRIRPIRKKISRLLDREVHFSGSGPSLFCMLPSRQEACRLSQKLEKYYHRVYVVSSM